MHTSQAILTALLISLIAAPLHAAMPPDVPKLKLAPRSAPAAAAPSAPSSGGQAVAPKKEDSRESRAATLKVGDKLPNLVLKNIQNQDLSLADLYTKRPIVLVLYRGGWCPFCNTTLKQWQDKLGAVSGLGADIVAVTPEKPAYIADTIRTNRLSYLVLSDSTSAAAKAIGVSNPVDESERRKFKNMNLDLTKRNADASWNLPQPTTLVIDTTGTIRFISTSTDDKQRPSPETVIAAVRAIDAKPAQPAK